MVFVGLIIILFIAVAVFYLFVIRKDLAVIRSNTNIVFTLVVEIILLAVAAWYMFVMYNGSPDFVVSLELMCGAILALLLTCYMFYQVRAVSKNNLELLKTIVSVLEAGDQNMDGHSLHVHNLVMLLYEYLPIEMKRGLSSENLKYASILFDVGKYGVPGRILNKSGKLEGKEWEIIKKHPAICVSIIGTVGDFDCISDWILYHHERVDGKGYYGLKGDDIPLASRMIALADTYSSITMVRAYKPTLTYEDAKAELKLCAGSQLDEKLVSIFCEIPMQKVEECMFDVKAKMGRYGDEIEKSN